MLSQSVQVTQALIQVGGITDSIFPQVESLILTGDYMQALRFIASRNQMNRYRSMVDFLFCELNTEWRYGCRQYYAGMGKALIELISLEELFKYNKQLLVALEVAVEK